MERLVETTRNLGPLLRFLVLAAAVVSGNEYPPDMLVQALVNAASSVVDPADRARALLIALDTLRDPDPQDAFALIRALQAAGAVTEQSAQESTVREAFDRLRVRRQMLAETAEVEWATGLIDAATRPKVDTSGWRKELRRSDRSLAQVLVGTGERYQVPDIVEALVERAVRLPPRGALMAVGGLAPLLSQQQLSAVESLFMAQPPEIRGPAMAILEYRRTLPDIGRYREALAAVAAIGSSALQATTLQSIASYLPQALLPEAVETARRIVTPGPRRRALETIRKNSATSTDLEELIDDVLRGMEDIRSERDRDRIGAATDTTRTPAPKSPEPFLRQWFQSRLADPVASRLLLDLGLTATTPEKSERTTRQLEHALSDLGAVRASHATPTTRRVRRPRRGPLERDQVVNTGFVKPGIPQRNHPRSEPLLPDTDYIFWFGIEGHIDLQSIETNREPIDLTDLPTGALLDVVLFPEPGGLLMGEAARVGRLHISEIGDVVVENQPSNVAVRGPHARRRLAFPLRTPAAPGRFRMRCNLYHNGVLLQSRLVVAPVGPNEKDGPHSVLDYKLASRLTRAVLSQFGQHKLSIMVNGTGDGTHHFQFWGAGGSIDRGVTVLEGDSKQATDEVRARLRTASWGTPNEWIRPAAADAEAGYLYQDGAMFPRLMRDTISFAAAGSRLWAHLSSRLSKGDVDALQATMLTPGEVQLASIQAPQILLPVSLIYDYPLDPAKESSRSLTFCEAARWSLASGRDLRDEPCFLGACPNYDDKSIVCPGGFWGFRHRIGVPLSADRPEGTRQERVALNPTAQPAALVGVSLAADLERRDRHISKLRDMVPNLQEERSRVDVLAKLKDYPAHLVYFYCHGENLNGVPVLRVGLDSEDPIESATLVAEKINWSAGPWRFVFLNGCHTTDLEPVRAINLASGFIERGASGVVGTEITIFEPLATIFGEAFVDGFLIRRETVGEAIRAARLKVLAQLYNPLGLVYIPFALANLHLDTPSQTPRVGAA